MLHGAISDAGNRPGRYPSYKELMERLQGDVDEVIIATNSSLEGETTAMYIKQTHKTGGNKGEQDCQRRFPVGGDLEYIDEVTLLKSA